MKENYTIIEIRGENEFIYFVKFNIIFEDKGAHCVHQEEVDLVAPLERSASTELVIQEALNAVGFGNLKKIRKRYSDLIEHTQHKNNLEVFYSVTPKYILKSNAVYVLISLNLWQIMKSYFENPERTELEKWFFYESLLWERDNIILLKAAKELNITPDQLDVLFKETQARDELCYKHLDR